MAGNLTVYILDVGPGMSRVREQGSPSYLEAALQAISLSVQGSMFHSKKDEVSVILFGTEATDNSMGDQEAYEHIIVMQPMGQPTLELLRRIHNTIMPSNGATADVFSALVLAIDVLVSGSAGKKSHGTMRVNLFSDLSMPAAEGGQMAAITDQLKARDIELVVIGDRLTDDVEAEEAIAETRTPLQSETIHFFREAVTTLDNESCFLSFSDATNMAREFRQKSVRPTTTFRGVLEIGTELRIGVWAYLRESKTPLPRLAKLSGRVELTDEPNSGAVSRVVSHHKHDEAETEVASENLTKAYRYGKGFVPFTEDDTAKFTAEKRLALLSFAKRSDIPRHHFFGTNCTEFVATPGDPVAATALDALVVALVEVEAVAIVRYVFRNNSVPKLGMLLPHKKVGYSSLLFVRLPFAEDLRDIELPPLTRAAKGPPPPAALAAMKSLVAAMDLMTAWPSDADDVQEALQPKLTFNPVMQHLYHCISHRALHPDEPLPPVDPLIARYAAPLLALLERAAPHLHTLAALLPLAPAAAGGRSKVTAAKLWERTGGDGVAEPAAKRVTIADGEFNLTALMKKDVTSVGSTTPVADFRAMVVRRDVDLLVPAARGLMQRIEDVVELYVGGATDPFIDMVAALRDACVRDEPALFNDFVTGLHASLRLRRVEKQPFLLELERAALSLITAGESPRSAVTADEAAAFVAGLSAAPIALAGPALAAPVTDDAADLLDEL